MTQLWKLHCNLHIPWYLLWRPSVYSNGMWWQCLIKLSFYSGRHSSTRPPDAISGDQHRSNRRVVAVDGWRTEHMEQLRHWGMWKYAWKSKWTKETNCHDCRQEFTGCCTKRWRWEMHYMQKRKWAIHTNFETENRRHQQSKTEYQWSHMNGWCFQHFLKIFSIPLWSFHTERERVPEW